MATIKGFEKETVRLLNKVLFVTQKTEQTSTLSDII